MSAPYPLRRFFRARVHQVAPAVLARTSILDGADRACDLGCNVWLSLRRPLREREVVALVEWLIQAAHTEPFDATPSATQKRFASIISH